MLRNWSLLLLHQYNSPSAQLLHIFRFFIALRLLVLFVVFEDTNTPRTNPGNG